MVGHYIFAHFPPDSMVLPFQLIRIRIADCAGRKVCRFKVVHKYFAKGKITLISTWQAKSLNNCHRPLCNANQLWAWVAMPGRFA